MLRGVAEIVPLSNAHHGVAAHLTDDDVLATATHGAAAYLGTGDHELQRPGRYEAVKIVSPRAFVTLLDGW